MRISLEAIESFAILCRVKSYSKTAKALGRSQPAISNRIKSLEALVGFDLFESGDPNLQLTENGRALLECSEEILQNIKRIRNIADETHIQPVRISFISTVESFMNPYNIFNTASHVEPSSLLVEMQNHDDLEKQIHSMDGNVVYSIIRQETLPSIRKKWPFTMRWISSQDFSLKESVAQSQLPIVELADNARFSNLFYSKFDSLGIEYKPVFRAEGINSYLNAIAAGVGVGCVGDLFVVQKMKSRNLKFLDGEMGNPGMFYLARFNDSDHSDVAARAMGIFDKAIDNQHSALREFFALT